MVCRTLTLDLLNGEGLEVPNDATLLDFLSAMYRDRWQPMHQRLKAAIEAAPYLHPRLAVTAVVDGGDFAARLERAIERSGKVINGKAIEGSAPQLDHNSAPQLDHKPAPMVPDRRFRRGA